MNTNEQNLNSSNNLISSSYTPGFKQKCKKVLGHLFYKDSLKELGDSKNITIVKTVGIYRYISLLVTSIMFVFINISLSINQRLTVILFLAVEAQVITFMYSKHANNLKKIRGVIILETIASVLLLYITGNLTSPFIWYCLNPIFCAAVFYRDTFCWENFIIFFAVILVSSTIYYRNNFNSDFIINYWKIMAIFFLIIFGLRQIMKYAQEINKQSQFLKNQNKELMELSKELRVTNGAMEESNKHIMMLYQSVEALISQENIINLAKVFVQYAAELTGNDKTFFWYINVSGKHHIEFRSEEVTKNKKDLLAARLYEEVQNPEDFQDKISIRVLNDDYLIYQIASESKLYGVLGIRVSDGTLKYKTYEKQLGYLSELIIIAIQRLEFRKFSEIHKVSGEQNLL